MTNKKMYSYNSSQKKDVLKFYELYIENFIKNDLIVLNQIQPNSDTGLNGCAIPTAMTILSAMELLGLLLNEDGMVGNTEMNIKFLLDLTHQLSLTKFSKEEIEHLCQIRHGIMHNYFPKLQGNNICIEKSNANALFYERIVDGNKETALNVNTLTDQFISIISGIKSHLNNCTDESVFSTIIGHIRNLKPRIIFTEEMSIQTTIAPGIPQNIRKKKES
jgi:hypothetical protein